MPALEIANQPSKTIAEIIKTENPLKLLEELRAEILPAAAAVARKFNRLEKVGKGNRSPTPKFPR